MQGNVRGKVNDAKIVPMAAITGPSHSPRRRMSLSISSRCDALHACSVRVTRVCLLLCDSPLCLALSQLKPSQA